MAGVCARAVFELEVASAQMRARARVLWLRVCMCVSVHVFVLYIAYLSSVVVQAADGGDFRVVCARACHLYGGAGCWRVRSRS